MRVCLFRFGVLCRLPDRDRHKGRHRGQRHRPKNAPPSAIRKPHAGPVIIQQAEPTGLLYTAVGLKNGPHMHPRPGTEDCPLERGWSMSKHPSGKISVQPEKDVFSMDTTNHPCTKAQTVLHRQNEPVHYHTGRNIRMRNGWRVPPCSYPAMPGKNPPAGASMQLPCHAGERNSAGRHRHRAFPHRQRRFPPLIAAGKGAAGGGTSHKRRTE